MQVERFDVGAADLDVVAGMSSAMTAYPRETDGDGSADLAILLARGLASRAGHFEL